MNMAGRMLLLIIILDTFLFFGMSATGQEGINFGGQIGKVIDINLTANNATPVGGFVDTAINTNNSGQVVPADSQTLWSFSAIVSSIFGLIQLLANVATAPFNFMVLIQAPLFAQVLIGGTYIVMLVIAMAQLISGRAA